MPDDDEDLDQMSPDQLRALRDELLIRIETVGSQDAALNPDGAEQIRTLDVLLQEIENRLSGPETGVA
jgi:hypothetical protein